ncbi:hypothetical protein JOY44_13220 [Phormidium sp. CLA17]|uniref:type II restriction endonuclease n=1 Tax=Leptolyngbya sp. Cla-17 TaxID=2803751 RepID=UPI001492D2AD|nr:type II restriction endonuclease [Leptolyngbya sp. Cla-17]MBM0742566.1 hypothetical protein [Leptolyngbya sp. Cla-17]
MVTVDFKSVFEKKLAERSRDFKICGLISTEGNIYPLGSDTKVLGAVFEVFTRPMILEIAQENSFEVVEATVQNYYPDFTLMNDREDSRKIAVDVKTTYIENDSDSFSFTLGGYTSFIRGTGTKNIVFPFNEYAEHWIIGYVYKRLARKKAADHGVFTTDQLDVIALPYEDVQVFVQKKWKISSDRAGSGNITNIGSTNGRINDFRTGNTPFESEEEFLEYWRNYERTAALRKEKFSEISEFREWKKSQE